MGFKLGGYVDGEPYYIDNDTLSPLDRVREIVKPLNAKQLEEVVKELEGRYKDKLLAEAMAIRGHKEWTTRLE